MRTWIVIADAASARVLESNKRLGDWTLVRELSHPESRAHAAQLVSDKPGRVRQISTGARVAMEPPTPLKRKEAEKFARQLAAALEDAAHKGAFERLILVTPPAFLGILREVLPPAVAERIARVVEKDYLHLDAAKLKKRLHKQLEPR
jgi:protein required for attachment to host cells